MLKLGRVWQPPLPDPLPRGERGGAFLKGEGCLQGRASGGDIFGQMKGKR